MPLKPSDFPTRIAALEYVNTQLDDWKERFRELESDMIFLSENPTSEEVRKTATKWQERAAELQEAGVL